MLSGPFRGLELPAMAQAEHIGPFLLGTYEAEIHPWLDSLRHVPFTQVVDVGAKFGFYAVGLARLHPEADVVAVDPDPWAQRATRQMATQNGTANVRVVSLCDPAWLKQHLRPGALIISDCEGYEAYLFAEGAVGTLATATLLIELHEGAQPGVTQALVERFGRTHTVERVKSLDEPVFSTMLLEGFSAEEMQQASREIRQEQEWMLLRPRPLGDSKIATPSPTVT